MLEWSGCGEGVLLTYEAGRFGAAYAITKALLPLRLIFSVWATPWFARVSIIPVLNYAKRVFGVRSKIKVATVGTAATGAGAVPKGGSGIGSKSG